MRLALAAIACAAAASTAGAASVDVLWGGGLYRVTASERAFGTDAALLESQVWWDDRDTADAFAALVDTALGAPNGGVGPFFAFDTFGGGTGVFVAFRAEPGDPPGLGILGSGAPVSYAMAEPLAAAASVSVAASPSAVPLPPAAFLLAGALAGLALRRRPRG